jgi:hypothetical protein
MAGRKGRTSFCFRTLWSSLNQAAQKLSSQKFWLQGEVLETRISILRPESTSGSLLSRLLSLGPRCDKTLSFKKTNSQLVFLSWTLLSGPSVCTNRVWNLRNQVIECSEDPAGTLRNNSSMKPPAGECLGTWLNDSETSKFWNFVLAPGPHLNTFSQPRPRSVRRKV